MFALLNQIIYMYLDVRTYLKQVHDNKPANKEILFCVLSFEVVGLEEKKTHNIPSP